MAVKTTLEKVELNFASSNAILHWHFQIYEFMHCNIEVNDADKMQYLPQGNRTDSCKAETLRI